MIASLESPPDTGTDHFRPSILTGPKCSITLSPDIVDACIKEVTPFVSKYTGYDIEPDKINFKMWESAYRISDYVGSYTYLYSWIVENKETKAPMIIKWIQSKVPAHCVFTAGSSWVVKLLSKPYEKKKGVTIHRG